MLTDWAGQKLRDISYGYLELNCPEGTCYGVLAVYRICFATTIFHLMFSIGMYKVENSQEFRAKVQNGYWMFKWLGWIALIVLAFFIPNQFIMWWGRYMNIPGATIFILIQVILLIDFAYTTSEALLGWWEETEDRTYLGILLFLTASCFIGSIVVTGFMYAWFGTAGCQLNQFFISFNLVLIVLTSVTSILPQVQEANAKSGLAQAAMVAIYSTYLIASALSSEPLDKDAEVHCNPVGKQEKTETTSVFLGSLFTFLALVYSTSFAATTFTNDGSSEPLLAASHLNASVEAGGLAPSSLNDDEVQGPPDDEQDGVQYNYSFFHFVFMIGAMYLAMLITNWDSVDTSGEYAVVGKSLVAVWVKVVSSWAVLLLFGWTLVAPMILPDRSWD